MMVDMFVACAGRKMAIWKMCPQSLLYLVKEKGVKNNRGTTSWDWEEERDVELKCIKEALLPKREQ